jgi:hypothetical protein
MPSATPASYQATSTSAVRSGGDVWKLLIDILAGVIAHHTPGPHVRPPSLAARKKMSVRSLQTVAPSQRI